MRRAGSGGRARLAALTAALVVSAAVAPAGAARSRPRVGLALGGGGARGLAHIGVLEYLHEHRVPVDCIAGTSMGALVGGIIAAGNSLDSLHALVVGADWRRLLAPSPTYANSAYRRKEDAREFPVQFEIGLRGGPQLPSGLNPGPHVLTLLSKLTLAHTGGESFDSLPIPFRCVATDLAAAAPVVLERGSLPLALRASMAIPGVFEPVWIDGRLLADGGLVDNVPVDVVRAMGADRVVAVDVYSARADTFPETLLEVLRRGMEIQVQESCRREIERADVVVRVDTVGLRTTNYAASAAIIASGYAAAARTPGLLDLALDPPAWDAYCAALAARRRPGAPVPQFVRVEGIPGRDARRFEGGLQRHVGVAVDPARLERDIDRLVGGGPYASASFEMTADAGQAGLLVQVRPKPHAPPTARFVIDANNNYDDLNLTLGTRVTFLGATTASSEVRVDAAVGAAPRFEAELFQPLGWGASLSPSGLFVAPYGSIRRDREDFYSGDQLVSSTRWTRTGAGADLGWIVSTRARVRAGYSIGHADEDLWIGAALGTIASGREQWGRIELNADFLDEATIPRRGGYVDAEARWYLDAPGVADGFGRCAGRLGAAIPSRRHDRTLVGVAGGASFGGGEPTPAYRFALGGPMKLDAFHADELRSQHFALARVTHLVALVPLGVLSGSWLYGAATGEIGSAFDVPDAARGVVSGSLGFAADTPIGPVTLGASLGTGGRWRIHFTAGTSLR